MEIRINLAEKTLKLVEDNSTLLKSTIVQGCEGSNSPSGTFRAGQWVKDKTNPKYGKEPWSKSPWGNPYGPYFLPIFRTNGTYTEYGIHGTRGPGWSPLATPPVPEKILGWFVTEDTAKFLYCSHGCLRISNRDILTLFEKTSGPNTERIQIFISREKE